ncbi:MAG TPA: 16S rRNA (cytidine(1402)-2'-O)-methyltransferase [Gemmatimonadaceae bacterium]|nr:16S rRNA (cytidine(1402)-2'-O)-methyltransferase [Gemmatimonadaceae bacterium]
MARASRSPQAVPESRVPSPASRLYLVSTPIGNLADISLRAIETLKDVALVLAEDTRHSRTLLDRYQIATPVESYHEHNEARMTPRVVERLRGGESVALITDAGTPLLSDPGARLVRAAIEAGVQVVPVPGASALLAALVVSGLPAERFTFFGFLPRKGRERSAVLDELLALRHTGVLYEAPSRVAATLGEIAAGGGGDRRGVVARELTKQFEDVRRGTVEELARYYEVTPPKGEVVIVVEGAVPAGLDEAALRETARELLASGLTPRDVARTLIAEHGAPRNVAYRVTQGA